VANVYLLVGTSIESSDVLRAFKTRKSLDDCLARCRAHEERRPQYPDHVEDTPENDAAFDLAEKKTERWRKRHPAGPCGWIWSDFSTTSIRLQE
jgi:hypothetical protein